MKTSFKRFAALALAAIMVLGTMQIGAYADTVGQRTLDNQLVISGLKNGDVVRFYKVLQESADVAPGWVYTSSFVSMSAGANGTSVSTLVGNPGGNPAIPHSVTADRAGQIARLIKTENVDPKYTETASGGKAVVTNPEPGMYVAIITPIDVNTVYNPVFVSADYVQGNQDPNSSAWDIVTSEASYAGLGAAKKSTLRIDKSADTSEDPWDDENTDDYTPPTTGTLQGEENSQFTTAIGDSVSFFVDTTIPGYGLVYENPQFILTDTLDGLDLIKPVVVKDSTGATLTDGTEYDFAETSNGYTLTFKTDYLKSLTSPEAIRVEYKGRVNTDAKYNVNVENNTVEIKYSTNPTDNTKVDVQKDETNHYTFTIDASSLFSTTTKPGKSGSELVKIGLDAANQPITTSSTWSQIGEEKEVKGPLEGATFKLFTDEGCNDEYVPKKADGTPGTPLNLRSGADGRFTIKGLDAGVYYLKEMTAPAGFIKYQDAIKIEIQKTIEQEDVTQWYYNGVWKEKRADAEALATADGLDETTTPKLSEVVKEYTYQTDVLKSYKILIDGQDVASHTFGHSSTNSKIEWSSAGAIELPASIPNTQGVELPSTGGIGTTIFYMGGAVLVLLAGVLLVSKRRIA